MPSIRPVTPRAARLSLALVFLAAACSKGTPAARTATVVTSEEVGASGANLVGPEGATVVVPADALAGNVTIVVSALEGVRTPTGTAVVGTALRLEPAGTTFDKPVEVTIPISPSALGTNSLDDVVIIRSEQNSDVFVPLPTRRASSGSAVVAVTEHFSDFVPVLVEAGMSPFGACGDAMCMGGETCDSCPTDCGVCVDANICGNSICEPNATDSESCSTCAFDCGECAGGTCGDGIVDATETCDGKVVGGTALEMCGCDDGDPCTADAMVMGSPSFCNVVCTHAPMTGFGIDSCDDSLDCTMDLMISTDPTACTVGCLNTPLSLLEWGPIVCDDLDPCTLDYAIDYDSLTCGSMTCQHEGGGSCGMTCGDGIRGGTEACDDANTVGNDGCTADCTMIESGYSCVVSGGFCWLCGDSIVTAGEACDDGNTMDGDGCEFACTSVTPGYDCSVPGQLCTFVNPCGNAQIDATEQCDDGNTTDFDGCDMSCTIEAGYSCPVPGMACFMATCGDGSVTGFEACDDANVNDFDGCSADCNTIETGYDCSIQGMSCSAICGDVLVVGAETCDDGGVSSGDGCDSVCTTEAGYTCPSQGGACVPNMTPVCGDSVIDAGETCDDGNASFNDGCDFACQTEPGWTCSGPGPTCFPICGDSAVVGNEACDDGNFVDNDGCSMSCTVIDAGYTCPPPPAGGMCTPI